MNNQKNSSKKEDNPLGILDDIENVNLILDEHELAIINSFFKSFESFNQITDNLEYAVSNNQLNERDIERFFDLLLKVVRFKKKSKQREKTHSKNSLVRTFFELPEILFKRILLFRSK
jgi:hypothetical protein